MQKFTPRPSSPLEIFPFHPVVHVCLHIVDGCVEVFRPVFQSPYLSSKITGFSLHCHQVSMEIRYRGIEILHLLTRRMVTLVRRFNCCRWCRIREPNSPLGCCPVIGRRGRSTACRTGDDDLIIIRSCQFTSVKAPCCSQFKCIINITCVVLALARRPTIRLGKNFGHASSAIACTRSPLEDSAWDPTPKASPPWFVGVVKAWLAVPITHRWQSKHKNGSAPSADFQLEPKTDNTKNIR